MLRYLGCLCLFGLMSGCATPPGAEPAPGLREGKAGVFDARHEFVIEVPQDAGRVQAWFPMPNQNDRFQECTSWRVEAWSASRTTRLGGGSTHVVHDTFDNNFLHLDLTDPPPGPLTVVTHFTVARREMLADVDPARTRPHTRRELEALNAQLGGQVGNGPLQSATDEEMSRWARQIVGEERNPVMIARKLYDAVLDRIEYHVKDPLPDAQKKLQATGTGNARKTYDTCTGNCTDFHSLYTALAVAVDLPTRSVYGSFFKKPLDGQDKDQSYHCWIEFHAPHLGWVPLDVAVADVFVADFEPNEHSRPRADLTVAAGYHGPDAHLVDYYFGNLEERRVSWHYGRDLVMSPPQAGPPLQWNATGYAEIDGKPAKVQRKLTFRDKHDAIVMQ